MFRCLVSEPFNTKLSIRYSGWCLLEQTVVSLYYARDRGKLVWGAKENAFIVNQITLLQSTGNSVSKDNWFVMFRCLVSEPFNTKLSIRYLGWRLLEQTVVSLYYARDRGKLVWGAKENAFIVNQITLLQSTGNSVSNGKWFVMLRCMVSEPFNTKLSMRYWGWRLLELTVVFWHKVKIVFRRTGMALIVFCMLYCNLHIILLQTVYDLLCLDTQSQILSTQNFSLNTVQ